MSGFEWRRATSVNGPNDEDYTEQTDLLRSRRRGSTQPRSSTVLTNIPRYVYY